MYRVRVSRIYVSRVRVSKMYVSRVRVSRMYVSRVSGSRCMCRYRYLGASIDLRAGMTMCTAIKCG